MTFQDGQQQPGVVIKRLSVVPDRGWMGAAFPSHTPTQLGLRGACRACRVWSSVQGGWAPECWGKSGIWASRSQAQVLLSWSCSCFTVL